MRIAFRYKDHMKHADKITAGIETLRAMLQPRGSRVEFARRVDVSDVHLRRLLVGMMRPSVELCIRIERETEGRVTRADLRPDIFGDSTMQQAG